MRLGNNIMHKEEHNLRHNKFNLAKRLTMTKLRLCSNLSNKHMLSLIHMAILKWPWVVSMELLLEMHQFFHHHKLVHHHQCKVVDLLLALGDHHPLKVDLFR